METSHNIPRAKSRGLSVPCSVCTSNIPYDPTSSPSFCSDCRQEATAPARQATNESMFTSRLQTGYYSNPSPMTPPSSLKRRAELHAGGASSRKRLLTIGYGSSNSSLRPSAEGYGRRVNLLEDDDNDDDDDEFEDAPEVLPPKTNEDYEDEDAASVTERMLQNGGGGVAAFVTEEGDGGVFEPASGETASEDSDLFSSTFGNKPSQDSEDKPEDEYGDDDEAMQEEEESERGDNEHEPEDEGQLSSTNPEEESDVDTSTGMESLRLGDEEGGQTAHGHHDVPKYSRGSIKATAGPPYPDWDHDLSVNFKRLQNFHNRAKDLIPRLPLPSHRYWIGVLNVDVNPKTFNQEKHFTWMKGNRLSTVETVWHMYQATTATDNFVLLLSSERVDFKDKMEELDYFNDKKVIFRAVDEEAPGSEGRSLIEGIIPPAMGTEVVEID